MPSKAQIEHFKPRSVWAMRLLLKDFPVWGIEDAAADLGNAGHESGGLMSFQEERPIVPGSRGGFGWYQWTGQRRVEYENYCKRNGFDPRSDIANYKFHFLELKGSEKQTISAVASAKTLEAKTRAFENAYERAGVKAYNSRIAWARIALAAYQEAEQSGEIKTPVVVAPNDPIATVRERLLSISDADFSELSLAVAQANLERIKSRIDQQAANKETLTMNGTKSFFKSSTIWGLVIIALSTYSPVAGQIAQMILPGDVSAVDPQIADGFKTLVEQLFNAVGLLVAARGRVVADKPLSRGGK